MLPRIRTDPGPPVYPSSSCGARPDIVWIRLDSGSERPGRGGRTPSESSWHVGPVKQLLARSRQDTPPAGPDALGLDKHLGGPATLKSGL